MDERLHIISIEMNRCMRSVWRIWLECRLYIAGKGEDPRPVELGLTMFWRNSNYLLPISATGASLYSDCCELRYVS